MRLIAMAFRLAQTRDKGIVSQLAIHGCRWSRPVQTTVKLNRAEAYADMRGHRPAEVEVVDGVAHEGVMVVAGAFAGIKPATITGTLGQLARQLGSALSGKSASCAAEHHAVPSTSRLSERNRRQFPEQ